MTLKMDGFFSSFPLAAAREVETRPSVEGANAEADARQARVTATVDFIVLILGFKIINYNGKEFDFGVCVPATNV
jgi:hypothetical protein